MEKGFHGSRYHVLGCLGKKICHIYLPGAWAAVTGPPHQMNSVASKRAAEEFAAGTDNVRLALCKH